MSQKNTNEMDEAGYTLTNEEIDEKSLSDKDNIKFDHHQS